MYALSSLIFVAILLLLLLSNLVSARMEAKHNPQKPAKKRKKAH